jgi:hypothetical protein
MTAVRGSTQPLDHMHTTELKQTFPMLPFVQTDVPIGVLTNHQMENDCGIAAQDVTHSVDGPVSSPTALTHLLFQRQYTNPSEAVSEMLHAQSTHLDPVLIVDESLGAELMNKHRQDPDLVILTRVEKKSNDAKMTMLSCWGIR